MAVAKKASVLKLSADPVRSEWEKRALRWVEILEGFKNLKRLIRSAEDDGILNTEDTGCCTAVLDDIECRIVDSGVPD